MGKNIEVELFLYIVKTTDNHDNHDRIYDIDKD